MSKLNERCFGCGKENKDGLQLEFHLEGDRLVTEVIFGKKYEGYPGIAHGGVVCSVMDEMMSSHLYEHGHAAMTAELQVRFKQPVPLEEPIRFSSEVENLTRRLWKLSAEARLPSGEVIVTARAKFLPARFELDGEGFDYEKKANREKKI